jgi:hypothetical protein
VTVTQVQEEQCAPMDPVQRQHPECDQVENDDQYLHVRFHEYGGCAAALRGGRLRGSGDFGAGSQAR